MKSGSRLISSVALFLLVVLSSGNSVLAADYSVEVGVDTRVGRDAGTLECVLNEICSVRLEPFGLKINVYLSSSERKLASVRMYGDEAGCCYFDGAAPSTSIVLGSTLSRLPIFRGRRAKGAFFIQNEQVGILYLRFLRR